jgi:hypothetical protein
MARGRFLLITIQRSDGGEFAEVGSLVPDEREEYLWRDDVVGPGRYAYRIVGQYVFGGQESYGPIEIALTGVLEQLRMRAAGKMPTSGDVRLVIGMPESGSAVVRVFDVRGGEVQRIEPGWMARGWHPIVWDSRGVGDVLVPAGMYWVRVDLGKGSASMKVVIVR